MAFQMQFRNVICAALSVVLLGGPAHLSAQNNSQSTSFRPAPRTLRQHLVRAQRALEEGEYGESVAELGALLAEQENPDELHLDSNQDFFVGPFAASSARVSLKSEARRLLGNMPEAARELYELQFGAEARALLEEAAGRGDIAKLTEVTRKYFHTNAGYEATLLLGRMQLDRGHPLAAAMCFERLAELPAVAGRLEPELSLLLASCWLYSERPDRAQSTLEALRARFPKLAIQIGGKKIDKLPAQDVQQWLAKQLGSGRPMDARAASQWVVYRGDGSRNAPSAGGSPLPGFRWQVPTASDETDLGLIEELRNDKIERRDPILPALHALAVQDFVLMRTPKRLVGLDFRSGKRVWEYPYGDVATDDISISNRPGRGDNELQARRDRLSQRMWQDAPYGQVSSDGKSVFMLDDLRQVSTATPNFVQNRGMRSANPDAPKKDNELVSLDLRREGSLRWRIGSDTGLDEPKLAGAFFLGPPLPVSGMLYVMAELKGEVRLLAIDPESGRQEWSQQLAHVDNFTIDRDSTRRLAGASPSYADGVLLCPTTAGAIVAVDIATRSLLWGYQYQPPPKISGFGFGQSIRPRTANNNDQWLDASLTLDDGVALVTPIDSNKLICLDLQLTDGKPRWSRPRDKELAEALYVACIHDGKGIVVTKHSVVAIDMQDEGNPVWEKPVELDRASGEMPSGRGFHAKGIYYLPTTNSRLLKIDLEQGAIVAEMYSDTPLGNLICYKDEVVSHAAGAVSCFFQIEPLRERVAARLKESADDAWALARLGELLLHDGKNGEALKSLQRAYRVDPEDDSVQGLLVATYLTALHKDFASHHAAAGDIEPLIDLPAQKTEYLQLMARGYHQLGKLQQALDAYVKLADVRSQGEDVEVDQLFLVKVGQEWSVRLDRWIHARLRELADTDDPTITVRLAEEVKARAGSASRRPMTQLKRDVACFGFHADSNPLRFALATSLLDGKRLLDAEHVLSPLRDHPDPTTSGRATALMAKLYMAATEYEAAAALYGELGSRWAEVPCDGAKTGRKLYEEAKSDLLLEGELAASADWPWGAVTASEQNQQTTQSLSRLTAVLPVIHEGVNARGAIKIGFDPRFNMLTVRDSSGRELFKSNVAGSQPNGVDRAQFMGHQGFIFYGSDLIAVDTLRSTTAQNESGDTIRWRLNIAPPLESPKQESGRANPFNQSNVRLRRNFDKAANRAISSMGPVNRHGVFYQRLKKLVCADPATGEPIWSRSDQPQGATVFGDDEYIFVVEDDSDQATVLRAADGSVLGQRQLPASANRWTFANRHVLAWEEQGERYRIYLRDIFAETDVWSEEVGPGTVGDVFSAGKISMLQRNGRFFIRSLNSDQVLVRRRLESDENLNGLQVLHSGEQYLVFASTSFPEVEAPTVFAAHTTNAPLTKARLYVFNIDGKPAWPVPAVIDNYGFPASQPTDSPALWFLRKTSTKQTLTSPQNSERTSLLCLDRRTGRIVFEKDNIPIQPNEFNVTTDASRRSSTLNLQGQAFTVEFTDEPAPPSPPAQTGAGSSAAVVLDRDPFSAP